MRERITRTKEMLDDMHKRKIDMADENFCHQCRWIYRFQYEVWDCLCEGNRKAGKLSGISRV